MTMTIYKTKNTNFIIDNKKIRLNNHLKTIIKNTSNLRICTGYFYLSGYNLLKKDLPTKIPDNFIQLLIGIEADSSALYQIGKGYKIREKKWGRFIQYSHLA